jgi:hypothetical protein
MKTEYIYIYNRFAGMEFGSVQEAFQFSNDYSKRLGFGAVVKRSNHKTTDGFCKHYSFACNRYKKVEEKDCESPPIPGKDPCLQTGVKPL